MKPTDTATIVINTLLDVIKEAEKSINKMAAASQDPAVMLIGLEAILKIGAGIQSVKKALNDARAEAAKEALARLSENSKLTAEEKAHIEGVIKRLSDEEDEGPISDADQQYLDQVFAKFSEFKERTNEETD